MATDGPKAFDPIGVFAREVCTINVFNPRICKGSNGSAPFFAIAKKAVDDSETSCCLQDCSVLHSSLNISS